jgi:hypothetical protein
MITGVRKTRIPVTHSINNIMISTINSQMGIEGNIKNGRF